MRDEDVPTRLARRLGLSDAVVVGLGSMLGAGVFSAAGPAAAAAGSGLLLGLGVAAFVAYCNATSSAALAARHPASGGAYVYGRERLGPFWGHLAGWSFVVGKTASCAAMALTVGAHAAPGAQRPIALVAVAALTVVNHRGIRSTVAVTRVLVTLVLVSLATVVAASVSGGGADLGNIGGLTDRGVGGILRSAGLLFFVFAGYARIATLGEEVADPARTIPTAIPVALGIALAVYAVVLTATLAAVGPAELAATDTPLVTAVTAGEFGSVSALVRAGGVLAALGVLLSLVAGVSRTTFAMAADGELPRWLATVHPTHRVPHHAALAVGASVAVLVVVSDLRGAIGFSSFCVLVYYAVANAAAWTLLPAERRWPRWLACAGLVGCAVLALTLPFAAALSGAAVVALGAVTWAARPHVSRRNARGGAGGPRGSSPAPRRR